MNLHRNPFIAFQTLRGAALKAFGKQALLLWVALLLVASPLTPVRESVAAPMGPAHPVILRLASRQPDRLIDVIVQYSSQASTLRQTVIQWGGQVTRDLNIINAFAARLPASKAAQLANQVGVRYISLDAPTYASSVAEDGTVTLLDEFDDTTYAETQTATDWPSGTRWSGQSWKELGESDGPDVGNIALVRFLGGQYQGVRIQGSGKGLEGSLNLADAISATLTLSYRRKGMADVTDALTISVSHDEGATWNNVGDIVGPATDERLQTASFDLSPFVAANLKLRMTASAGMAEPKVIYIDAITVTYVPRPDRTENGLGESVVYQTFMPLMISTESVITSAIQMATSPDDLNSLRAALSDRMPMTTNSGRAVLDVFSVSRFDQNNGWIAWAGDWVEFDPASFGAGPNVGSVRINANNPGTLTLNDYPDSQKSPNIARKVDLSNTSAASLAFSFSTSAGVDASDEIVLEISRDGGQTYSLLDTITGITGATAFSKNVRRYNITSFATAQTMIRFRVSANYGAADELFSVDWVGILYDQITNAQAANMLLPSYSEWKYLDNGSNQGTAWRNFGFDDTNWAKGMGQLGYGDGDEQTTVSYGSNAQAKYVTTYFRRTFNVSNAAQYTSLNLQLIVDDGAVVYLNGTEVARSNLPLGTISSNTYASSVRNDLVENQWVGLTLPVSALVDGENVLAVEMHQASASDPDMSFDALLYGYTSCTDCANASKAMTYTRSIKADLVWNLLSRTQGQSIGVAVVDSGVIDSKDFVEGTDLTRMVARVSLVSNSGSADDANGHGSHVAGIIAGNGALSSQYYSGVAPKSTVIDVRVTDDKGAGSMSDVIAGLQWILDNQVKYNIRIVNMSLNSPVAESYHTSPLDAALEILWIKGIVVVVSGGNNGAVNGNVIYPPANDPFVISVGSADDKGTASISDDTVSTFSAAGTTLDGFAKPDIVAPGRNIISLKASDDSNLSTSHLDNQVDGSKGKNYFRMSGTSMAAGVVAGAAALLLQDEPNLNPDQVKYRLMSTANKSWAGYSSGRAGAGYLDVLAAVTGNSTAGGNVNLPVSALIGGSNYVSDLTSVVSINGYGPQEKDTSNGENLPLDGKPITLNGVVYRKGLGVHANSELRYNLNGKYGRFVSDIGVDDEMNQNGSVIFRVYLDGVLVYDSGIMTGKTDTKKVSIDVTGKNELRLIVTDAGDNASSDHADWANASLTVAGMNWASVNWSSVNWSSVNWSSVNWSSVNWSSVNWSSDVWE